MDRTFLDLGVHHVLHWKQSSFIHDIHEKSWTYIRNFYFNWKLTFKRRLLLTETQKGRTQFCLDRMNVCRQMQSSWFWVVLRWNRRLEVWEIVMNAARNHLKQRASWLKGSEQQASEFNETAAAPGATPRWVNPRDLSFASNETAAVQNTVTHTHTAK